MPGRSTRRKPPADARLPAALRALDDMVGEYAAHPAQPSAEPADRRTEVTVGGVVLAGEDDIAAYLRAFPDVIGLLPEFVSAMRDEFGPDAPLTLAVNDDPSDRYLVLCTNVPDMNLEVMKALRRVATRFNSAFVGKRGWIFVTAQRVA